MRIDELWWDEDNIGHFERHRISPDEVEEVMFLDVPISVRARAQRYAVYGQTTAGRYIVAFLEAMRVGQRRRLQMYRAVTARQMTETVRRRYQSLI